MVKIYLKLYHYTLYNFTNEMSSERKEYFIEINSFFIWRMIVDMTVLLIKFFMFSFVGFILECVWLYINKGSLRTKRMLINLPMCPVYGIGAVLYSLCISGFSYNPVTVYILGCIVASCAEFLFYSFFLIRYNILVWDYGRKRVNFKGGICLEYSLLWGVAALFYVYFAEKAADFIILKMSEYLKLITVVFLGILFSSDTVKTFNIFKKYRDGVSEKLPDCFWYMTKFEKNFKKL